MAKMAWEMARIEGRFVPERSESETVLQTARMEGRFITTLDQKVKLPSKRPVREGYMVPLHNRRTIRSSKRPICQGVWFQSTHKRRYTPANGPYGTHMPS